MITNTYNLSSRYCYYFLRKGREGMYVVELKLLDKTINKSLLMTTELLWEFE